MKDVTVLLELTVPKGVSDQEIKSFVEGAIKNSYHNGCDWAIAGGVEKDASKGILGMDANMTDVVGIHDSAVTLGAYPPIGFRPLGDNW